MPFASTVDQNLIAPYGPNYLPPIVAPTVGTGGTTTAYQKPATPAAPDAGSYPGSAPDWNTLMGYIQGSPLYKQGMENIDSGLAAGNDYRNQIYNLQGQLDNSSHYIPQTAFVEHYIGENYIPEKIPQAYYDTLEHQKSNAAYDKPIADKAIQEALAGRGLYSSGQLGFEMGQSQHNYDSLLEDIRLGKALHEQDVANANERGQANVAQQNARGEAQVAQQNAARQQSVDYGNRSAAAQEAQAQYNQGIQRQIQQAQLQQQSAEAERQAAADRYTVLQNVSTFYQGLWWNGSTYVGPGA